ncbi:hypothetical protein [Hahella sp. NBU794]|uniref:hypothetical protein n=1 Tax=Hahella sp. NBU794 TaxID=3422590 RepID=UPI003D6E7137
MSIVKRIRLRLFKLKKESVVKDFGVISVNNAGIFKERVEALLVTSGGEKRLIVASWIISPLLFTATEIQEKHFYKIKEISDFIFIDSES